MFRDKYKDENYFQKKYDFNFKAFERREGKEHKERVLPQYINKYYISQSTYAEKLLRINYALGNSLDEVFKWFKISLRYYQLSYGAFESIYDLMDYLSLAVLFEDRKEEFIEDVEKIFSKYQSFVDSGEQYEDGFIETLALYLLKGEVENFHSHLEYLNMIGNDADSVIEAQKFWYYAHSEASWYDTHKTEDAYYGYWSFDTAALCKMRGIYDERFKDLDFFPYDLLVQER
ncbi:Domain of uncharacterised function (DUF1911) [Streptococcus cristatus]|uniref:DUF1911 domain-containing protein n=2 Tax=Streptococcus cristatus TaxID=45634 RepID=A0A512AEM6_STRCR|nr:PoNe immunity protein domain-containing protein [Streptococcus cristatus]AGK71631.1 hypothetical protein I872_07755 [Streptococcus cristatus AS 1.3089]GEN98159.1 hypothetical protein SOL01_20330 [Streptococcus cristatus]SQI48434.1 Domain of uncharacterised function (DUF1911) [Streptococcus cristatus]